MTLVRRSVLVVFVSAAVSGDCAAARMELQPEGAAPACAIEIEFRTRRGEIDMRTLDRIMAYVEASPAIQRAYDERRGDDENPALCLVIENKDQALAVFEQLTILVPPQRARLPRLKPPPPVVLRYTGG